MQLHLPGNVLPVEMRVPPTLLTLVRHVCAGPHERYAEEPLGVPIEHHHTLSRQHLGRLAGRIYDGPRRPFVFVHGGTFTILRLPCVVDLQPSMKLVFASLKM